MCNLTGNYFMCTECTLGMHSWHASHSAKMRKLWQLGLRFPNSKQTLGSPKPLHKHLFDMVWSTLCSWIRWCNFVHHGPIPIMGIGLCTTTPNTPTQQKVRRDSKNACDTTQMHTMMSMSHWPTPFRAGCSLHAPILHVHPKWASTPCLVCSSDAQTLLESLPW